MSEQDTKPADDQKPDEADVDQPEVDEWKPEPRTWGWKDLFTAPMLAFKPKCMVVSVLTLIAVYLILRLSTAVLGIGIGDGTLGEVTIVGTVMEWLFFALAAAAFGMGASFVAVFYKADLLDDEFLSFKEGCGQYKGRLLPSIMVPLFLVAVTAGMGLAVYLGQLISSIPWAGSILYVLFYATALSYLVSLFALLICVGVTLSVFVFPAIVAVRKHGWFDNVIDTFEAVGTKPHVLVASIAVTLLMTLVAYGFGVGAMANLKQQSTVDELPGTEVQLTERAASDWLREWTPAPQLEGYRVICPYLDPTGGLSLKSQEGNGYYVYGTGLLTGIVQSLFLYLILGYCVNIILAGGMLTYLNVREDDYWDDEDLEDLDKLAKELEEEAKAAAEEVEREAREQGDEPVAETTDPGFSEDQKAVETIEEAPKDEQKSEEEGEQKSEEGEQKSEEEGEQKSDEDEKKD